MKIQTITNFEEIDLDVNNKIQVYEDYHQLVFSDDEDEIDSRACNMTSDVSHINLRQPSKEEIDKIIVEMVAQVKSNYGLRNMTINDKSNKGFGIFRKDVIHKMAKVNKVFDPLIIKVKD